jgi:hypothetical protein
LEAGGVWFEQPQDAVLFYQNLLKPSIYPSVRDHLFAAGLPLTAWRSEDEQKLHPLWMEFIHSMAASTNVQIRLDAQRLAMEQSDLPQEKEAAALKFAGEAWNVRSLVYNHKIDAPVELVLTNLAQVVGRQDRALAENLRRMAQDWTNRFAEAKPDFSYETWKDLLAQITNPALRGYTFSQPEVPPRPQQVEDLLNQLDKIDREKLSRWVDPKTIARRLTASATLSSTQTAISKPNAPVQFSSNASYAAHLSISRKWNMDAVTLPKDRGFGWVPRANYLRWVDGRLWFEAFTSHIQYNSESKVALISLDPTTMQGEIFEPPRETVAHQFAFRRTLVADGQLFVCAPDVLWCFNRARQWHPISLPQQSREPFAFGKNVVLATEESILSVNPETSDIIVLASSRRNPPLNALDQNWNREGRIMVWQDGRLCALASGRVWIYDRKEHNWTELLSADGCGESLELHPTGIFYRQSGVCGPRILGGWRPGRSVLEYYSWELGSALRRATHLGAFTPPFWILPEGARPHESKTFMDGPNTWIFPAAVTDKGYTLEPDHFDSKGHLDKPAETNYPSKVLYCDKRFLHPLELTLDFAGPAEASAKAYRELLHAWGQRVEFLPTPQGLAILVGNGEVLWVPKQDLERALDDAQRVNPQPERFELIDFQKFDQDHNGWLNDAESLVRRKDQNFQKQLATSLQSTAETSLKEHRAEWDLLFTRLDTNHDAKLSTSELAAAVKEYPQVFDDRLRGVNNLSQATRPFDLDDDFNLELPEFRAFLAEPRLIAEVNRSLDWLSKFGLKPELCDTNDNGILDPPERLLANQLIRKQLAQRKPK